MNFNGKAAPLSSQTLRFSCAQLDCSEAALWAVLTVETRGSGFLPDGRLQILFERHVFHRLSGGRFDVQAPDLSNSKAGGYGAGGASQYDRLARAMALDTDAALASASWGLGQIMGFNAQKVGFVDAAQMVEAFVDGEDAQLIAMAAFVSEAKLASALGVGDWTSFARGYNGAGFAKNGYDKKLSLAHSRFATGPTPDLRVRWIQAALLRLGHSGIKAVDGWFGERTQKALLALQQGANLERTGRADEATIDYLAARLNWTPPV